MKRGDLCGGGGGGWLVVGTGGWSSEVCRGRAQRPGVGNVQWSRSKARVAWLLFLGATGWETGTLACCLVLSHVHVGVLRPCGVWLVVTGVVLCACGTRPDPNIHRSASSETRVQSQRARNSNSNSNKTAKEAAHTKRSQSRTGTPTDNGGGAHVTTTRAERAQDTPRLLVHTQRSAGSLPLMALASSPVLPRSRPALPPPRPPSCHLASALSVAIRSLPNYHAKPSCSNCAGARTAAPAFRRSTRRPTPTTARTRADAHPCLACPVAHAQPHLPPLDVSSPQATSTAPPWLDEHHDRPDATTI
jgi:hypothetical protein